MYVILLKDIELCIKSEESINFTLQTYKKKTV